MNETGHWDPNGSEAVRLNSLLEFASDELVAFRRRLHAHPELSHQEFNTTKAIASRLETSGLRADVMPTGTGLTCDVQVGDDPDMPTIALRADIDALAMDDESTTPYKSAYPGVAHACGHDVHSTILLGAGLILNRMLADSGVEQGRVRLIFEPAEESLPGGATQVIEQGRLDGVSVIYGLHCEPKLDVGTFGMTSGPITSAADLVDIELSGPGGHTARPELTVDLVRAMGDVARDLPDALNAELVNGSVKLTFGHARAGDAPNVVPSSARLFGTLRTQDMQIWQDAPRLLENAIAPVVEPTGASWELSYLRGVPPVINDIAATEFVRDIAESEFGAESITNAEQSWGGDTFAWYLEKSPGSYIRLGTHNPQWSGRRLDLHASTFDVDERAIGIGVRLLVATALSWLTNQS